MALIVEDGSNVANANSFVDVAEIRAYATARGVTLAGDDSAVETLAIRAMDYLTAQRARYQGVKTSPDQSLQFPRTGVVIDDAAVSANAIPVELKNAQCQLCLEGAAGVVLLPSSTGPAVKRERVEGAIEIEYAVATGSSATATPDMTAVDALLDPLFKSGGWLLSSLRV